MKRHTKLGSTGSAASNGSSAAESAAASATAASCELLTPGNLQTAYSGEANAHARYLSFAREAEEEGYEPVASLFRAAARSEEIHARNYAELIHRLGFDPNPVLEPVIMKSTRENLDSAIKREVYERDEMYPIFVRQARVEGNQPAARSFHLALKAETEHAALFAQAAHELERLRGEAVVYYICPICGFTSSKADGASCPVCANPTDRFERLR